MNPQIAAVIELHQFFENNTIPYAIIGGIAVQLWGEPRFTRDVDVTILVPYDQETATLHKIFYRFKPRISNAFEFAFKHRVCLIYSSNECEIDISLGIQGYEEILIQRAAIWKPFREKKCKICTAEDLIIHKAVSGRLQDILDIEGVMLRQRGKLDIDYVRKWLHEFDIALESKEISKRFEK